mgnify:CR=1 FL=1
MELEEREREKTGIKNLKIKFNKVFGYYFRCDKIPTKILYLIIISVSRHWPIPSVTQPKN